MSGGTRPRLCGGCPVHVTWPRDGHKELQNRPKKATAPLFAPAAPLLPQQPPTRPRGLGSRDTPRCSSAAATKRAKIAKKIAKKKPPPLFFCVVSFRHQRQTTHPTPPSLHRGGYCGALDSCHAIFALGSQSATSLARQLPAHFVGAPAVLRPQVLSSVCS